MKGLFIRLIDKCHFDPIVDPHQDSRKELRIFVDLLTGYGFQNLLDW